MNKYKVCSVCGKKKRSDQFYQHRKECKACVKERTLRTIRERKEKQTKCVYKITCKHNNRIYIGQTRYYETRKNEHLSVLRSGKHYIDLMNSDFQCFGEGSFVFEILTEIEDVTLLVAEEAAMIQTYLLNGCELYNTNSRILRDDVNKTKICRKCKAMLPYSMFAKHSTSRDLLAYECRDCKAERERERRRRKKNDIPNK